MFGIDSPELLVILVVALIFIGPKELPGMLRTVGRWVATARNMASEFRGHVDDMVRQADLDEVKKTIDANTALDLPGIDPMKEIKGQFQAGVDEAQAEIAQAKAAIADATSGAEIPPPVDTAELVPPPALEPIADPTPAVAPAAAAEPATGERPAPADSQTTAGTPTPANEPGPPPAKVAVG